MSTPNTKGHVLGVVAMMLTPQDQHQRQARKELQAENLAGSAPDEPDRTVDIDVSGSHVSNLVSDVTGLDSSPTGTQPVGKGREQ